MFPSNLQVKAYPPVTHNVTILGKEVFKELIKMALIRYDWYSQNRDRRKTEQKHRENTAIQKPRVAASEEAIPAGTLISNFWMLEL